MTTLMILGGGHAQRPLYETARRVGLQVLGADPDPHAPALALAQRTLVCDLADDRTLLETARDAGIAGVLTVAADYPMPSLSRLCSELGLSGPPAEAVRRATNKGEMRAAFTRAGVPSPASCCVHGGEDAWRQVQRWHGSDLIVKPSLSSGGRGVTRLSAGADEREVQRAYAHAAGFSRDRSSVQIEHFVDGPEYSIESVVWKGRHHVVAITDKLTTGAPHCVEIGHHQPASVSARDRAALAAIARDAVAALGVDGAVCHTEAKLTSCGPVIIESAARAGGGFITSHLVPLSTGVDLMEAAIRIALGGEPDLQPRKLGMPAAIRFIIGQPGRLRVIAGTEIAATMDGVADVQIYRVVGDEVRALQDATARCGHVIAVGPDVESAVARACAARDAVHLETRLD